MTDANKPSFDPSPPPEIQEEIALFERLATAAGIRDTCPMCTNSHWYLMDKDRAVTGVGAVDAFALSCTNCGFIRLHARGILDPHREGR